MKKNLLLLFTAISICGYGNAQDNMDSIMNAMEPGTDYVSATFKGTRVIHLQSTEKAKPGSLQFIIQHRFGAVNGGLYHFFGLDQATMRMGFEYGIHKFLSIGIGRSTYEKTFDAYAKANIIRESRGKNAFTFSVVYFGSIAVKGIKITDPEENKFSSRLSFTHQLIIGKKVSDRFSFEIVPTLIHKNYVYYAQDKNDFYAIGTGARFKLTKRTSFNAEYIYRLPYNEIAPSYANFYNSFSLGFDIETGGHVFQLHITNSLPMFERGFITETKERWSNGGIHMGFNLSRDFTLKVKNKASKQW